MQQDLGRPHRPAQEAGRQTGENKLLQGKWPPPALLQCSRTWHCKVLSKRPAQVHVL